MSALTLIAAVARDGAIGRNHGLPWRLPEDLRHFRALTRGHPVIMGRKTWESLPVVFRPLPERRNLIVSRNAGYRVSGGEVVRGLADALALTAGGPTPFVIGGAELYALALPHADRMELTEIDLAVTDADAWFPAFSRAEWQEVARVPRISAEGVTFAFVTYARGARIAAA
ncbi:MAG: dihydrofolate reductase [Zoogloeaceae bacterium]|jgi:dihydrofolate reductase|nr:dihydrofolate reductase [Zoogloeaceae bacterium]